MVTEDALSHLLVNCNLYPGFNATRYCQKLTEHILHTVSSLLGAEYKV